MYYFTTRQINYFKYLSLEIPNDLLFLKNKKQIKWTGKVFQGQYTAKTNNTKI